MEALSDAAQGRAINLPVKKGPAKTSGSDWVMILFFLFPVGFIGSFLYLGTKYGVQSDRGALVLGWKLWKWFGEGGAVDFPEEKVLAAVDSVVVGNGRKLET